MSKAEKHFDPRPVFNHLGLTMADDDFPELGNFSDAKLRTLAIALAEDDGSPVETHMFYLERERTSQQLQKKMREMACTDPLTGLYNRRFFEAALGRELARIERGISQGSALIMIDLDGFKPINDTLGHNAGNAALIAFAMKVSNNLRAPDIFARIGGDEFAMLAVGVEKAKSELARSRVADLFPVEFKYGAHTHEIFASVGACPITKGQTVTTAMKAADDEMYKIKGLGRALAAPRHDGGMR